MGEGGRRISGASLDPTDGQSLVAGPHEEAKYREPRFGAARGEALCGFLDGERGRRCCVAMNFHETRYLAIMADVNPAKGPPSGWRRSGCLTTEPDVPIAVPLERPSAQDEALPPLQFELPRLCRTG